VKRNVLAAGAALLAVAAPVAPAAATVKYCEMFVEVGCYSPAWGRYCTVYVNERCPDLSGILHPAAATR